MKTLQKVRETVDKHKLLDRDDSVLIALSGGPDSVALLRLLIALRRRLTLSLSAVYINHRIRPRASKKEEVFCGDLCDRYKIDLTVVSEDIPALAKSQKRSLEETARDFRYGVFEQLADEDNHARIALGHHADDRAETVMFRILRGTGAPGLAGIPVSRGKIIRPLFDLTKAEILAYLKQVKQSYCYDTSNRKVEFSRNYIRNRLLPQIRERLNPQVDAALLGLSETASAEEEFLGELVEREFTKSVRTTPGGKLALDLKKVNGYDMWLRRRMLRRCLKRLSPKSLPPEREVVERLERFCRLDRSCRNKGRAVSMPGRVRALIADDDLVMFRTDRPAYRVMLNPGQQLRLDNPRFRFESHLVMRRAVRLEKKKRAKTVLLDWSKIRPPLTIRNICAGDRFRPLGLKGSKKVGDYLTDRKVPKVFRDEIPLLCDSDGVVWLVGYEIADRVKLDKATREVLSIGYHVRKGSQEITL